MPTAIQTVGRELERIQKEMAECISPEGYVYNHCKYQYQELVRQARDFQASKTWLEGQQS